jgi:hypothetical protein
MKVNITLIGLLALTVPALAAPTPVVVDARAAEPGYGDYGKYPPPPGGYGGYGTYGKVAVPSPVPTPATYGSYPKLPSYAGYGSYKRVADYIKSLFE